MRVKNRAKNGLNFCYNGVWEGEKEMDKSMNETIAILESRNTVDQKVALFMQLAERDAAEIEARKEVNIFSRVQQFCHLFNRNSYL